MASGSLPSPNGLDDEAVATITGDDVYWQADTEEVNRRFGLRRKVAARRQQRLAAEEMEIAR